MAEINEASELESRESTFTLVSQSGVIETEVRLVPDGLSPTEFDRDRRFLGFGVVGVLEAGIFEVGVFNLGV